MNNPSRYLAKIFFAIFYVAVAAIGSPSARAVTTNWIAGNGEFTTPSNWDNGVPDGDDTAVFDRGFVAYEVNFPGGLIFDPPPNYTVDVLRVATNEVGFVYTEQPFRTIPSLTADEIEIGPDGGDVAILNMTLKGLSAANATMGGQPGSKGTLNVSGGTLTISNGIYVGGNGIGTMNITAGGQVSCFSGVVGVTSLSQGSMVTVSGAGSRWVAGGDVAVGYPADFVPNSNRILQVSDGGVVAAEFGVNVYPTGRLHGDGAIEGDLINRGLVFPGMPVGTLHVEGDYLSPGFGGYVYIELASAVGYDKLSVDGDMQFNGVLDVSSRDGYAPTAGDTFDILDWTGSSSGAFDIVQLPPLTAGLDWDASQLYTMGIISVVIKLQADFDDDGDVDGDDFNKWRRDFADNSLSDADDDGDSDGADFLAWQRQFSSAGVVPSSTTTFAAVPEPATLCLAAVALAALATSRGPRHSRRHFE